MVPAPEVDCSVSDEAAPVPPMTSGSVIEVVKVGAVPNTATPVPVSSVSEFKRYAEVAVVVARDDASRKSPRAAVSELKVIWVPVRVGLVPKTAAPEPVSSVKSPASSAEVSSEVEAMRPLNDVQLAAVRQPWVEPLAVAQLSVFTLHERPVPAVIRVEGVL